MSQRSGRRGCRRGFLLAAVCLAALPARAQGPVQVQEIAPGVFLHSTASSNLVLFSGREESMVAGVQEPALVASARETLRTRGLRPVRWAVLMESDSAPGYGDGGWAAAGAVTMAQENFQLRMARRVRPRQGTGVPLPAGTALPVMGFSQVVQVYMPGEEVHIVHERTGYTNADVVVHFEDAGLVYLGNSFTSDGYPQVDTARGGSIAGMIATADFFLNAFARNPASIEPIVPGRGPVADMAGLRAFREMLVAVRDRVQALRAEGKTVEQVVAARPTADLDARWGCGPVTPPAFVAAVYASLARAQRAATP